MRLWQNQRWLLGKREHLHWSLEDEYNFTGRKKNREGNYPEWGKADINEQKLERVE